VQLVEGNFSDGRRYGPRLVRGTAQHTMTTFTNSLSEADTLIAKAQKVNKGATMEEADIGYEWMAAYATIARRCRDDKDFGFSRYPYEQGPGVGPFNGGYFEHREWPIRRGMERHSSLRPLYEYEAHYMNAVGYWMAFHQSALALRQEYLVSETADAAAKALKYDVWGIIAVRYGLRVVGLRVEFYKRSAKDPMHARLIMPALEGRNDVSAADDLDDTLGKLDTHMASQLMKAVASLSATNAVKRGSGDGAAGSQ
jgi:hypothetical protein